MQTRVLLIAAFVLPWTWTIASADIAPKPRPTPPPNPNPAPVQSKEVNMVVEVDPNAKEARLIVPRSLVVRRAGLDADDGTRLADAESPTSHHIMIAGIALSLAACGGGFWLVRKNRLNSTGLVLFLVIGAGLVIGAMALANARAPSPPPPPPQPPGNLLKLFDGKIKVETPAEGDSIRLIVNEEMLAKIVKENLKREAPPANPTTRPAPTQPNR
jgi:hypothetical protein